MYKKTIRKLYFLLAWVFAKLVLLLPYRTAVRLGGFLGSVAYHVVKGSREITEESLRLCFPEKGDTEIRSIAREVFINQGKNAFELFSFPKLSKDEVLDIAQLENPDAMKQGFSRGGGVLIASAHCGNWEIMAAALSLSGFPINVIAKKIYIEELNDMLVNYRKSKGVNVILRSEKNSAKEILKGLRSNQTVGMLIDQDTDVPGVFVDFFSRPAWTPSGLAVLALKTGASVVTAFDVRMPDDTHRPILSGPVEMKRSGDHDKDVIENTQIITKMIESHIRKYPSQWVWMHRRWKTKQKDA